QVRKQCGSLQLAAQDLPETGIAGRLDDVREVGHEQEVPSHEGADHSPGDPGADAMREGSQSDREEWRETHKTTHAEGEAAKPVRCRAPESQLEQKRIRKSKLQPPVGHEGKSGDGKQQDRAPAEESVEAREQNVDIVAGEELEFLARRSG